jgi:hypothetical protein
LGPTSALKGSCQLAVLSSQFSVAAGSDFAYALRRF